jgi:hypothetical protein
MTKKPILMEAGHTDELYTPAYALNPLLLYIPRKISLIWECACGQGHLVTSLRQAGFGVVGTAGEDFFKTDHPHAEMIISNPPYSLKDKFLARAYELEVPFAFLLPLSALGGKRRTQLFGKYGLQLIVPDCRVNFITPNGGTSSWFHVAWFTHGLRIGRDLTFVKMERK